MKLRFHSIFTVSRTLIRIKNYYYKKLLSKAGAERILKRP